jgi:hypothetical protein
VHAHGAMYELWRTDRSDAACVERREGVPPTVGARETCDACAAKYRASCCREA